MEDKDKIIEELNQEIESLRGKVGALQSFKELAEPQVKRNPLGVK